MKKVDIVSAIFINSGRLDHMLRPDRGGALNALPAASEIVLAWWAKIKCR